VTTNPGAGPAPRVKRAVAHGYRPMTGRDPEADHRVATPLELLFDLTFVIAFSVAGSQFAHLVAEGHYQAGLIGFCFAMFAVMWAWIQFTWFASAYDTDDWVYRLTTMVQMTGVVVLALGLPAMFHSLDEGDHLDIGAMVVGYIIMRVPMLVQWWRASRQDPAHQSVCKTYIVSIVVSQVGWTLLLLVDASAGTMMLIIAPLILAEASGPWFAEHRDGGTPWHPHHIAERYGLLAIIALGEVLLGTIASLGAIIDAEGWTADVVLVALGGVGLTFGLWWIYFLLPAGDVLHRRRDRAWIWSYGHIVVYAAIAAVGAGLHVVALYLEHEAHISATAVMLAVAIPVATYFVSLAFLYTNLVGQRRHATLLTASNLTIVAISVVLAEAGVDLAICICVLALSPVATVIAEENGGRELRERDLDEVLR
jgi:low temperature requirement protein LtrA